jgi:hypothetical protein
MVDQPAAPTIEQRYDIQCVTSRQIRPIIRETRLDRWLARPMAKKISRILMLVLWPALSICQRMRSLIPAREESRIRSRLNASKSSRKRRAKNSTFAAGVLPPPAPVVEPTPEIDAPLMKMLHPALFHNAEPKQQPPPPSTLSVPVDPNRRSIFSSAKIEPAEIPVVPQQVELIVPPAAPVVEPEPVQAASVPAPAVIAPEPIIEVVTPASAIEPVVEVVTPAPAPIQVEERLAPPPEPEPQVQPATPEPAAVSHEELSPVAPSQLRESRDEEPEKPAKPRPPVAHPRQMRRRPRPSYNR